MYVDSVASEVVCESRIESVTVYARGAVVTRRVTLPEALPDEPCEVVIGGVTSLADVGTLRAAVDGGRDVLAVRARLVVPEPPAVDLSLAGKLDELRRRRDDLLMERNHVGWRREVLASVQPEPDLTRRVFAINPADRVADALAVVELVTEEMAALDAKIAELTILVERNERESEALKLAAAQASAAEARASAPSELSVSVQLGPTKKAPGTLSSLQIEYAVAAARWWPAYRARFTDGATRAALALTALVAQASGEDWVGVKLALSTGDLLRDARLPEATSLRLGRAQKPRPSGYRAPPEGLDAMFEGFDRFVATVAVTTTVSVATQAAPWDPGAPGYHSLIAHDDEEPTAVAMLKEMPKGKRASKSRQAAQPPPMQQAAKPAAALPPPPSLGGFGGAAGGAPPAGFAQPPRSESDVLFSLSGLVDGAAPAPARSGATIPLNTRLGASRGGVQKAEMDDAESLAAMLLEETGTIEPEPQQIEPADAWLDFDMLRLDSDARGPRRGRLTRERGPSTERIAAVARLIEHLEAPPGTTDPRASRGLFDVVYSAAGSADIPSSGRPHRVSVATAESGASPRFVTVPREAPEVYRRADVSNPFGVPLLTGPVEVFIDGALVALTRLSYTDRGGSISIGLGVEERVKVARNTRVEEGTAGLLGGSTTLEHSVTTDLSSSLGRAIKVEILDRLPVSDDKDVEIKLLSSQPQPSPYSQAEHGQPIRKGLKWEVEVPAGGKASAAWRYRVLLPSKMEIVGGNRRE